MTETPRKPAAGRSKPGACRERLRRAKEIIQSSIDSHESWAAYRRRQGTGNPEYGDLEHHETCLREYAEVMALLEDIDPGSKP